MVNSCTVTALYTYPVKSCRGTRSEVAELSPEGVLGDRQLVVLRDGRVANQVSMPKLASVAPKRVDSRTIAFEVGSGERVVHELQQTGEVTEIVYYGNEVSVVDQGDRLAGFVSATLGVDVRVAALDQPYRRSVPLEEFALVDGTIQDRFVDVAPVLVTNEASLADLNSRLDVAVPMDRFRPNIVVQGLPPFGEDDVETLAGDGWRLLRATHCERCAATCTDQETGERSREPLATLASYRRRPDGYAGGVLFGAYMAVEGRAAVRIGDVLQVS